MPSQNLKIIFLGTPDFAIPILQALVNNKLKPVLVITQPDEPQGRKKQLTPPPVKVFAQENDLEVAQPKTKKELAEILKQHQPDICVLVAYGEIISQESLDIPKRGFINVHPSLLPKYRGSSPIQTAILNQDDVTGVTIMKMDAKMDHGPILAQQQIEISLNDNNQILHEKLADAGSKLLLDTLPKYIAGEIKPQAQNADQATFTNIIKRSDGQIDWQKSAKQIQAQFRAFYPWPGIFTTFNNKRLKITKMSLLKGDFDGNLTPGEVFLTKNKTLAVQCGQGAIVLESLQLEGKKEVSAKDFLQGYKDIIGSSLSS